MGCRMLPLVPRPGAGVCGICVCRISVGDGDPPTGLSCQMTVRTETDAGDSGSKWSR